VVIYQNNKLKATHSKVVDGVVVADKSMSTENTNTETNQVPQEPAFDLTFPPLPHSDKIAELVKSWAAIKTHRQSKLITRLKEFFSEVFFAGGAGTDQPPLPKALQQLGAPLLSFLHLCINREWKEYHFQRGFASRPDDEQKRITEEIRKAKEAAEFYAHLPQDGAEIQMKDGMVRKFDLETLKKMVDKGMLPPNPKAKRVDVNPIMAQPPLPKLTGLK